jgi:hypothetical protein
MLKKPGPDQTALEMAMLDQLVPADHLLRKIDAVIDFSFIHDRVADLYCADNGRPPLDPTLLFKALFIGYKHYRSDPATCRTCPLLASCTSNAKAERILTRHVWQESRERADGHRLTAWGKAVYKRRKETVERSFADAKQLHGHRYARFRSLVRVQTQCLLAAAAQNIKKIAMALTKAPKQAPA